MIRSIIPQIKKIFVGRNTELEQLEGLWDFSCEDVEHPIYVFLNAPGVGKTTLINHFGKLREEEGKGLFIRFVCSSDYDSPSSLNESILYKIRDSIRGKQEVIENYFKFNIEENQKESLLNDFKVVNDRLDKILAQDLITINNVAFIFQRLSTIIPVFFAADEIQEFQGQYFVQDGERPQFKETMLHYFTRVLKDLLNSRILLVLSGTRYRILSQIGERIGSPIRNKVKPLIIQKFEKEEVLSYISEFKNLFNVIKSKKQRSSINNQLLNYQDFLFAFSGGHPRTIENISELFINNLQLLLADIKYVRYNSFLKIFLPKLEDFFNNSLLSSVHKEALYNLEASEMFSIVKEWLLNGASRGQFLGARPRYIENPENDGEIKRIVYELMNIGIIVQNGNYNYHITSFFHLQEFLDLYHGHYEAFLREVLHNKHFRLMCGFHSGFGYTFENIFSAALIIYCSKNKFELSIPFKFQQIKSVEVLKNKVDWADTHLESNVLYQTPTAEAIDGFLLQEKKLLLLQLTTANPPNSKKIDSLISEMETISNQQIKGTKDIKIYGWLVSLFDLKDEVSSRDNVLITTGNQLIPFIGEDLYMRLKSIKESFKE